MTEEALTCGTCRRWVRGTKPEGETEVRGECRAIPPQIVPIYQLTPIGTVQMQKVNPSQGNLYVAGGMNMKTDEVTIYKAEPIQLGLRYPPTHEKFPACSQYMKREEWNTDEEETL